MPTCRKFILLTDICASYTACVKNQALAVDALVDWSAAFRLCHDQAVRVPRFQLPQNQIPPLTVQRPIRSSAPAIAPPSSAMIHYLRRDIIAIRCRNDITPDCTPSSPAGSCKQAYLPQSRASGRPSCGSLSPSIRIRRAPDSAGLGAADADGWPRASPVTRRGRTNCFRCPSLGRRAGEFGAHPSWRGGPSFRAPTSSSLRLRMRRLWIAQRS